MLFRSWADGSDISLGNVDPIRGRRTVNTCEDKRKDQESKKEAGKKGQEKRASQPTSRRTTLGVSII